MSPPELWDGFREEIRDALTSDSIRSVWHTLGARLPERHADGWLDGYGPAALGEGGKGASFGVNLSHGGYRDLGGGGASGDIFRGVEECLGLSSAAAAVWLAEALRVPVPDGINGRGGRRGAPAVRIRRPVERPRVEIGPERPGLPADDGRRVTARELADARDAFKSFTDDARALRAYLYQRGIGADAWARYQLALVYDTKRRPWLYVPARWELTDDPAAGGAVVTHAQRWAFNPTGGPDGRGGWATGADGRKLVRTDGGTVLFPNPADADAPATDRPGAVLCEGPWDTIAARAAGFDAFGVLGVSAVSADDLARLAARPHARHGGLCVAFDGDDGGRAGTARVLGILRDRPDILAGFGGRVTDAGADLPDGDDVNSYAMGHGADGLAELIRDAGDVPDLFPDDSSRRPESDPYDTDSAFPIPGPYVREGSGTGGARVLPLFGFEKPPRREWTVEGWIPEGYATILAADGGSGKSFLAMFAALSIATGRPFLGRAVKRGTVLYADFELDHVEQKRRLWAVLAGFGLAPDSAEIDGRLHYVRPTRSLADGGAEEIAEAARAVGASLVILDSLTIALGGDSMDQQTTTAAMNALRQCGTVLALDHVSGAGARGAAKDAKPFGSVFKRNLARSTFQLATEEGGVRILRPDKSNFGPGSATVTFRMDFDGPEGEALRFVPLDVADDADAAVTLRHLSAGERIETAVRAIYAADPALFRATGVVPLDVEEWLKERMEVGAPSLKTVQNSLSALASDKRGAARLRKVNEGYLPADADPFTDAPGVIGGSRGGSFTSASESQGGGDSQPPPSIKGSGIGKDDFDTPEADSPSAPESIGKGIGNGPGTEPGSPPADVFDPLARPMPGGLPENVEALGDAAELDGDGYGLTDADDFPDFEAVEVAWPSDVRVAPPRDADDLEGLRRCRDAYLPPDDDDVPRSRGDGAPRRWLGPGYYDPDTNRPPDSGLDG